MAEMPDVVTGNTIASQWGNLIRSRTVQRYADAAQRTTEHPTPAQGDLSFLEDTSTVWVFGATGWVNVAKPVNTVDIADDAVNEAKLNISEVILDGSTRLFADVSSNTLVRSPSLLGLAIGASTELLVSASQVDVRNNALVNVGSVDFMQRKSNFSAGLDTIPTTLTTLAAVTLTFTIPATWGTWSCEVNGKTTVRQTGDSTSGPSDRLIFQTTIAGTFNEFQAARVGRQTFGGSFGIANSEVSVPIHGFREGIVATGSQTVTLQRSRNGLDNVYSMLNTVITGTAVRTS